MQLFRHPSDVTERFHGGAVAIGNFDGVHLGHQTILKAAVAHANALGRPPIVLTFEPHPRQFFQPEVEPFRLTPLRRKTHLFESHNIAAALVLNFDEELASFTAEQFMQRVIVDGLKAAEVIVGEDFQFGKDRSGSVDVLKAYGEKHGFSVSTLTKSHAANGQMYSSSEIRDLLKAGKPKEAALLLGRPWTVEGRVVHGDSRGAQLGFPTANVMTPEYLVPKAGVYAVTVQIDDEPRLYKAVANFGMRPTVGGTSPRLEAHLFNFDGDLYEKHLQVAFMDFIRPEQKFDGLDQLKAQIEKDCKTALERLSN